MASRFPSSLLLALAVGVAACATGMAETSSDDDGGDTGGSGGTPDFLGGGAGATQGTGGSTATGTGGMAQGNAGTTTTTGGTGQGGSASGHGGANAGFPASGGTTTGGTTTGGSPGASGHANAGSTGVGGSVFGAGGMAGSPATGGASSGGSTQGTGGGPTDACGQCETTTCAAPYTTCTNDNACVTLANCLAQCASGDTNCQQVCGNAAPQSAIDEYNALGTCVCQPGTCGTPCMCDAGTGGSGGSGTGGSGGTVDTNAACLTWMGYGHTGSSKCHNCESDTSSAGCGAVLQSSMTCYQNTDGYCSNACTDLFGLDPQCYCDCMTNVDPSCDQPNGQLFGCVTTTCATACQ